MPSYLRAATLLAGAAMALTACGTSARTTAFPLGSYDSDAYTVSFEPSGTFRYLRGDQLMVQGQYLTHDSTVSLTDQEGPDACVGAEHNPGIYIWSAVGDTLQFRMIQDPCPDRIRGLANQAWKPH